MNSSQQHIIDEYLMGNMELTEHNKFEEQLANDADLRLAVQEQRELIGYVDALGDIQMKERVRKIHTQEIGKTEKVRKIGGRQYAIAAAVAMMLGFALWMFLRPPLNERLYAEYYAPHAMTFASRGDDANQHLVEAGQLYKNGNYELAASAFEKLLNDNIDNKDGVKLALGVSLMELGKNKEALVYFEELINDTASPYYEQALWYNSLVGISQGEYVSAKKYLRVLSEDSTSYYYKEANLILKELEN